jgi:hypothetical protein
LSALRQIGGFIKELRLKERGGAFASIRRENWGIHQVETAFVEKIPTRAYDLMTDPQSRMLSM